MDEGAREGVDWVWAWVVEGLNGLGVCRYKIFLLEEVQERRVRVRGLNQCFLDATAHRNLLIATISLSLHDAQSVIF